VLKGINFTPVATGALNDATWFNGRTVHGVLYTRNYYIEVRGQSQLSMVVVMTASQRIAASHGVTRLDMTSLFRLREIVMVALWNRADHYIFMLWFVLLLSFFFFLA